ncbi:metal-binding protein [Raoultella ornithinolytica]|nr:metal-binding protein [Raoultella ornithinolytica]
MKNSELEQLINEKLNSATFSDYAPNGLQVKGVRRCKKLSPASPPARRCWTRPCACRQMR